ncbi:serine hydrolase [Streptomyces sp. NPDC004050]
MALPPADNTAETDADGALLTRGAGAPGAEPESRAESDGPEPARDTVRHKTDPGGDHVGAAPPLAATPAAAGNEAASSGAEARSSADSHADIAAEARRPTGGTQPARGAATSGDSPVAQPEAEARRKADRSPRRPPPPRRPRHRWICWPSSPTPLPRRKTPRRTAVRRVKVWTPVLLVLAGAYAGAQLLRPLPAPRLVAAEASRTVDGQFSVPWPAKGQGAVRIPGSGEIGTFGEQKPVPTASVAKVMTAYVILKDHPLRKNEPGPEITVDAKAVAEGTSENESRIKGLTAGSKFSQQDMLKMLMIPSGNNAARLLARWDSGSDSEAAFVEKMNAAARDLGMKDTTYTDPSGLDAGTVSTATDQLKLAEAVMKDEVFRTIVAMPSAPIKGLAEPLVNNNELLSVQGLSVYGIKTGSSTPAGGALMWAARKSVGEDTPLVLGTLMEQRVDGSDPNATKSLALVLAKSRKIIEAVRTALASTPLVRKGDTVGYVDDGFGGRTPLVAAKDLNVIGVPGQRFKLALGAGTSPLPHAAKAGTEVGTLTAGEGEGAKSVPVAVGKALVEPSVGARLTRLG